MCKVRTLLLAAIFGGITGAAAAIVLAPGSGDETRAAVRDKVDRLVDEFKAAMQERQQELEAELREFKQLD